MSRHIMAVGAHPDDIEYGCGGALLRHAESGDAVTMVVLSDGARGGPPTQRLAEQLSACGQIGAELEMLERPDGDLGPVLPLIDSLEHLIGEREPDIVYTHLARDQHQDHAATHHAVRVAARRCRNLLLFESPSSAPLERGVVVDISDHIKQKIALLAHHASQVARMPQLGEEGITARAYLHGTRFGCRYAELFEPVRYHMDPAV
ncbi:PIG-L deacetylase family protein [Streptomyces sp. NPDC050418]|uniref:PIG-L deacetylase family protein n=1 Tax=Streptomyces sp. NPDC050418 TaxID=3365612 RepID=UPI00379313D9